MTSGNVWLTGMVTKSWVFPLLQENWWIKIQTLGWLTGILCGVIKPSSFLLSLIFPSELFSIQLSCTTVTSSPTDLSLLINPALIFFCGDRQPFNSNITGPWTDGEPVFLGAEQSGPWNIQKNPESWGKKECWQTLWNTGVSKSPYFKIRTSDKYDVNYIWLYSTHAWQLVARCTAITDSVIMNSRTQKILCCIVAILLSTDAAAWLWARRAL